jgi:hypothetical protein
VAEPGYTRRARRIGSLLAHPDPGSSGAFPVTLVTEISEPAAHLAVHVVGTDDDLFGQAAACEHDDERERLGTTHAAVRADERT